jgi:hypothetical protein
MTCGNRDLHISRRTLMSGLTALTASALMPALVGAEGGLKGGAPDQDIPDDLAAIGVTGDGSYESPLFGYRLEWEPEWSISSDPGASSADDARDTFRLEWTDSLGAESTMLEFNGFAGSEANMESWLEGMLDPETLSQYFGNGAHEVEVLLTDRDGDIVEAAWVLGTERGSTTSFYMLSSYRLFDDGLVLMSLLALTDADLISSANADLIDGVFLNGEPLIQLLKVTDIEDAFAQFG